MTVFNIKGHVLLHVLFLPSFRTIRCDLLGWEWPSLQVSSSPCEAYLVLVFIDAGNTVHDKWPVQGAKSPRSCLTLCDPMDCSPPNSSVHGILQARILEWGAISFSRESSWPREQTCISCVSCISRWILYHLYQLIPMPNTKLYGFGDFDNVLKIYLLQKIILDPSPYILTVLELFY